MRLAEQKSVRNHQGTCPASITLRIEGTRDIQFNESPVVQNNHQKKYMFTYGNYCGPNWSGGKRQPSIAYPNGPPAIDRLDNTCRVHDHVYANVRSGRMPPSALKTADEWFAKQNLGKGVRATVYGAGVGIQGLFRKKKLMAPTTRAASKRAINGGDLEKVVKKRKVVKRKRATKSKKYSPKTKVKYSGKKRRGKKKSYSRRKRTGPSNALFQKYGSVTVTERGGVTADPQAVYLGAGANVKEIYRSFCRAVVHSLYSRTGTQITNWQDKPLEGKHQIDISFIPESATVQSLYTTAPYFANTDTFETIAGKLQTSLQSSITLQPDTNKWLNAILYDLSNTVPIVIGTLSLQQMMLELQVGITISVQNQTPSDSGSLSTEVVATNPVKGKVYQVNGNYFCPKNVKNNGSPQFAVAWALAQTDTGLFGSTPFDDATKKPPPKSYFERITKCVPCAIMPGNVLVQKATRTQKFSWSTAMKMLAQSFSDGSSHINPTLGCAIMVGVEKMLDTRTEGEVPVTMGIQSEVWVKCRYYKKGKVLSAIRNVVA